MLDIGPAHRTEYELDAGQSGLVVVAEAPGRFHYMGEHGERGAGLYLSSAIDRTVQVAVSLRADNSLRFFAADLGERKRTTLINLKYKREDRWANFIKVAVFIFAELGYPVKGLNFTLGGTIPQQVGLASSSAIEAAAALALKSFFRAPLPDRELIARLVGAEETFLGREAVSPVDFLVAFNARKDHLLLVDERSQEVVRVKSPFTRYKTLLMDSRVPRMGVEDELRQRREDTRRGLEHLAKKRQGQSFRDYVSADLLESMGDLREEIRRRSLHVVDENQRIREAAEALEKGDRGELSRLIYHSHESLRDLYEVSCPEIDWLVKRAQEIEGVAASRMTGAGFGGCTYTILKESALAEYRKRLEDYERIFGFHPLVHEVRPAPGARIIARG
ncbi:MAG: galactokinase [Treponema sp.]|jgi:galactokinase|nr:galactokinase [Treponema sp.]